MRIIKSLVLLLFASSAISVIAEANHLDLSKRTWSFRFDDTKKMSVEDAAKLPESAWQAISLGDYWQNLGFPDKQKHPLIAWYRCQFNSPEKLNADKLVLRIGAIDDIDKTYLNGHLIGQTNTKTRHYWIAQRVYPIPAGSLKKDGVNTLLIRVEDLRGKGGLKTGPFEIIPAKDIPKLEEKFNPLNFRTASLEFSVQYADAASAQKAKLVKLPLFDAKKWAFTMRWDDNNKKNFRMYDLMEKYGFKGAFYLNSKHRNKKRIYNTKALCGSGIVLGGHSMTHPKMPILAKNEMFYEAAAIRVELESDTDTPVVAFAFPGGAFQSSKDSSAWPDIGKALTRCGYHHNCYPVFVNAKRGISPKAVSTVQWLAPGDRKADPNVFEKKLNKILKNSDRQKTNPNITWGVHVWLDDEGWVNAEQIMKKYQGRKDWWYCSPNDYAAYRYLYHHSNLEKISINGALCVYRLTFPYCADLGADLPLSLKVENAVAQSCSITNGKATKKESPDLGQIINIYQPLNYSIPKQIDASSENSDQSTKFPGLKTCLSFNSQKESLTLTITNNGTNPLERVFLKLWLPLRYKNKSSWIKIGDLAPGKTFKQIIPLEIINKSSKYNTGSPYFVAQLDFLYNKSPGRYYSTFRKKKE